MGFLVGAMESLANVFDVIFSRLDALGDRTKILEGDFEKLATSLDEAATHAAQYAVEVKFEELEDGEDLKDDLIRLADSVANREEEARDYFCRVESLEDQIEAHDGYWSHFEPKINRLEDEVLALKDLVRDQDKVIKRLDHGARYIENDRIDALDREVRELTDLIRDQDKVIKALLKALEWEPPKD